MGSKTPVSLSSVKHPSHDHPLHVFKPEDEAQDEEDEIICSGCELDLTEQAFKCTMKDCDYFFHKSCFDLPREINHKCHPGHPLTLLHSSSHGESFECSSCGEDGSGFTYNCSERQYDLHVRCAFIPDTVEHEDHEHSLTLLYNKPCNSREDGAIFICGVCEEDMSESLWVYYCKECDYETHVHSCAASKIQSLIMAQYALGAMQLQTGRNAVLDLAGSQSSFCTFVYASNFATERLQL